VREVQGAGSHEYEIAISFPDERSGAPHLHVLIRGDAVDEYIFELKEHFGDKTVVWAIDPDDPPCLECRRAAGTDNASPRHR